MTILNTTLGIHTHPHKVSLLTSTCRNQSQEQRHWRYLETSNGHDATMMACTLMGFVLALWSTNYHDTTSKNMSCCGSIGDVSCWPQHLKQVEFHKFDEDMLSNELVCGSIFFEYLQYMSSNL